MVFELPSPPHLFIPVVRGFLCLERPCCARYIEYCTFTAYIEPFSIVTVDRSTGQRMNFVKFSDTRLKRVGISWYGVFIEVEFIYISQCCPFDLMHHKTLFIIQTKSRYPINGPYLI